MDKNVAYTCLDYYSATKRYEILIHATTRMNLKDIMLSEISQTQKDKHRDSTYTRTLEWSNP